ncbi:single-stranded DNA-binding protein [Psychromicrobium xiongbiense]|uniref:single-stranded DNA-binding protein n=1 Tax=Psychromicrobium xiongbiense TaxID=3051184 RepID=UPI00255476FD|nr:single-stranded DNA-binding protein [Psychromicrobium sp. YIM S02556]
MTDVLTIRGFVASEVKMTVTKSGFPVANFRLGSTERRFDRERNEWVDAATNWYSVSMFRALAQNASASISKGERVIVQGKLRLRQWVNDDGRRGIAPEIEADAVGHDLGWGTANFRRAVQGPAHQPMAEPSEAEAGADPTEGGPEDRGPDQESDSPAPEREENPGQESMLVGVSAGGFGGTDSEPPF